MAAFTKYNQFVQDMAHGVHKLNSDTIKIALTNTAPSSSNAVLGDISEISAGNGYSSGGATATLVSSAQTGGVYRLILTGPTFTASGGSIATFRYAVAYNSTQTSPNKPLIASYDYGATITITNGNSFAISLDGVNGLLTIT